MGIYWVCIGNVIYPANYDDDDDDDDDEAQIKWLLNQQTVWEEYMKTDDICSEGETQMCLILVSWTGLVYNLRITIRLPISHILTDTIYTWLNGFLFKL